MLDGSGVGDCLCWSARGARAVGAMVLGLVLVCGQYAFEQHFRRVDNARVCPMFGQYLLGCKASSAVPVFGMFRIIVTLDVHKRKSVHDYQLFNFHFVV